MSEEEKKDNVLKVSVPIFNNIELKELDYKIDNYLNDIVSEINKTVSKDRDIIILKKVIEKQQKEIEKKDKIINEMGEHIEKGCDFDSTIQTKQEVIEYFTNKYEEGE